MVKRNIEAFSSHEVNILSADFISVFQLQNKYIGDVKIIKRISLVPPWRSIITNNNKCHKNDNYSKLSNIIPILTIITYVFLKYTSQKLIVWNYLYFLVYWYVHILSIFILFVWQLNRVSKYTIIFIICIIFPFVFFCRFLLKTQIAIHSYVSVYNIFCISFITCAAVHKFVIFVTRDITYFNIYLMTKIKY